MTKRVHVILLLAVVALYFVSCATLSDSWGAALFGFYLTLPLLGACMSVVGVIAQARMVDIEALRRRVLLRTTTGALGILSVYALIVAGWPGVGVAALVQYRRRMPTSANQAGYALAASHFGVAALLTAGVLSVANLGLQRFDAHGASYFAWLWLGTTLIFLAGTLLSGSKVVNAIRSSPGPVASRLALAATGSLAALVASSAVLDANSRGTSVDVALLEDTVQRVLRFKNVAESLLDGAPPRLTAMGWLETAAGGLYWLAVIKGLFEVRRTDSDHVAVAQLLVTIGHADEALVHLRKLKTVTAQSKLIEAAALLALERREDALKAATQAGPLDDDPRSGPERLIECCLIQGSTGDDIRWVLAQCLRANVSDANLFAVVAIAFATTKLTGHELESLLAGWIEANPRSYTGALIALCREDLYDAATRFPPQATSPFEELIALRLRLALNLTLLDERALDAWIADATQLAQVHFRKLEHRYQALLALDALATLWSLARELALPSEPRAQRTWQAALSMGRERDWFPDNAIQASLLAAESTVKGTLPARDAMLRDQLRMSIRRGLLLFAEQRYAESVEILLPVVTQPHDREFGLANMISLAYVEMGMSTKALEFLEGEAQRRDCAEAWLALGASAWELGDAERAAGAFRCALEAGDESARVRLARALARIGRADEARQEFSRCAAADGTLDSTLAYARFLRHVGDAEAAEHVLREALVREPGCVPAYFALVEVIGDTQPRVIRTLLEAALERSPDDAALLKHAAELITSSDPQRALFYLEQAEALRGDVEGSLDVARWLGSQERFGEAKQRCDRALEREPTNTDARYLLAWTLDQLRNHAGAEAAYRALVQAEPTQAFWRQELALHLRRRQHPEAEAELLEAIRVDPNRSEAVALHIQWLEEDGRNEEAMMRVRSAIARFGEDSRILDAWANLASSEGDHNKAIELRTRDAEASNTPRAWLALGEAYQRCGENERAATAYQRVITSWPDDRNAASSYARALWSMGKLDDAEKQYRANTVTHGELSLSWIELASFLAETGRADLGVSALRKAQSLEPSSPEVYLAMPCLLSGATDRAELIRELRAGADLVRNLKPILLAAADYYETGSAVALASLCDRIDTEQGARFLNAVVWHACSQGEHGAELTQLARRAALVCPRAEVMHTASLALFLDGELEDALRCFERFVALADVTVDFLTRNDVALLLRVALQRKCAARLTDVLRGARRVDLWRGWADALDAIRLEAPMTLLSSTVAERVRELTERPERDSGVVPRPEVQGTSDSLGDDALPVAAALAASE